ncbi:hypothetical protein [Undibacterium sp. Tian12W]|uniref:hypothetical protein n=1 Tax=Undibacterium sp. Tian12W TaxID=3413054 RepID=UPI003BEFA776
MRNFIKAILLMALLSIPAFASAGFLEDKLIPKEESAFAKDYLQHVHDNDFAYVKSKLDPELLPTVTDDNLLRISAYFPGGEILSTELIGSQVNIINGVWTGNFTVEYHTKYGWAVGFVALKRIDTQLIVTAFSVHKANGSQEELNRFTLSGKSVLHYLVLIATVCVPLFILVTLITCIKTPIPKRKWLWIVFIILSIGAIQMNWTSGEYRLNLLQFQLFGAALMTISKYAPCVLTAGFPLGAILFWFWRPKYVAAAKVLKQAEVSEKLSEKLSEQVIT